MVCYPVHQGTYERSKGSFFSLGTHQFKETLIAGAQDIARTVEYLRRRSDVRPDQLVYMGYGAGAIGAPRILVTTPGFRAAVLVAGGYPPMLAPPELEVTSPFHYTPHVDVPVLLITGKIRLASRVQGFAVALLPPTGEAAQYFQRACRARLRTRSSISGCRAPC